MVKLGLLELNIFYTITIHVLFLSLVYFMSMALKRHRRFEVLGPNSIEKNPTEKPTENSTEKPTEIPYTKKKSKNG